MKKVTKQEFDEWLKVNTGNLDASVIGFCEPPCLAYYAKDTKVDGRYTGESIVATVTLYESYSKDDPPPYQWAPNEYRIDE